MCGADGYPHDIKVTPVLIGTSPLEVANDDDITPFEETGMGCCFIVVPVTP